MGSQTRPKRKSNRLKEYDYSQSGAYFVTICTKDSDDLFGEIQNGTMIENEKGAIVHCCWEDLPRHYTNVALDVFVVMPNHVHGIIMILNNDDAVVGARHASPLRGKRNNLGNIVGSFKSPTTAQNNRQRKTHGTTIWQRGYYDHIIRSEKSLNRIREYIDTNPQRWQYDKENQEQIRSDTFDRWLESEGKKSYRPEKGRAAEVSITKR